VGLNAVTATMYMSLLGKTGIRKLASLNHDKAEHLKRELVKAGFKLPFASPTFNEFVVELPKGSERKHEQLLGKKIVAGLPLATYYPTMPQAYLMCVTETKTRADLDALVKELKS
jgi:glycine dehydrogenase subunit 1